MKYLLVLPLLIAACGGDLNIPPTTQKPATEEKITELTAQCQEYLKRYSLPLRHTFDQALPCNIEADQPWPPEVPWMTVRTTACKLMDGTSVTYKTENYFDMQVVIWYKNGKIAGYDSPNHPMCSTQYQDLVWREKLQTKDCVETTEALCIY